MQYRPQVVLSFGRVKSGVVATGASAHVYARPMSLPSAPPQRPPPPRLPSPSPPPPSSSPSLPPPLLPPPLPPSWPPSTPPHAAHYSACTFGAPPCPAGAPLWFWIILVLTPTLAVAELLYRLYVSADGLFRACGRLVWLTSNYVRGLLTSRPWPSEVPVAGPQSYQVHKEWFALTDMTRGWKV